MKESEFDKFMAEYETQHKLCPKCKAEEHSSTEVCYIPDMDHKDEYKDSNQCECANCGDIHTMHERVAA
jgi:hypothetical protein